MGAKFVIRVYIRITKIKTEYWFYKDTERVVLMVLGAVKIMRFLCDRCT